MRERLAPLALVAGTLACLALVLAAGVLSFWTVEAPPPRWFGGMQVGLWIYLGFFGMFGLVVGWVRRQRHGGWWLGVSRVMWWIRLWHGWVVLIVLLGAVAGFILFPIGGAVFGIDQTLSHLLLAGLRDGAFYALIWAPGISVVLCFMLGYERAKALAGAVTDSSKTTS